MDVRSLRYFLSVYREGNFSAAAKACFVSQPSISAAVTQLESVMNVKLFVRHKKGVTATEAGKKLYPIAERLVAEVSSLKKLFATDTQAEQLNLSVMPSLDLDMVSVWLNHWLVNVDGLQLSLVEYPAEADLHIVSEALTKPGDIFIPLWSENYVIVAPKNRLVTLPDKVALSDLQNFPFIKREQCELTEPLNYLLDREHITLDIKATVSCIPWAISLVKSGLGIAIVPESSATNHMDITVYRFKDLDFQRRIGLVYNEQHQVTATIQKIIDLSGGVNEMMTPLSDSA